MKSISYIKKCTLFEPDKQNADDVDVVIFGYLVQECSSL